MEFVKTEQIENFEQLEGFVESQRYLEAKSCGTSIFG